MTVAKQVGLADTLPAEDLLQSTGGGVVEEALPESVPKEPPTRSVATRALAVALADRPLDETCDACFEQTEPGSEHSWAPVEPGVMMKHFQIQAPVGSGGMGQVYRARDVSLERDVALKVISEDLEGRPGLIDRFIREARAQARLNHPNVVSIYYIGRSQGRYFFAMELIRGESLQAKLDRDGPLPWGQCLEWMVQAARALQQATRRGIVHRDIKPANLMINADGQMKIADFGLARRASDAPGISQQGTFMGTPLYVAPEQARGETMDHRADMYALGATFFHLMAGRPPYEGSNSVAVMMDHATAPVPLLHKINPDIPKSLSTVVARLMAKKPGDRYDNYESLRSALNCARPRHELPAGFWVRSVSTGIDLLLAAFITAPLQWFLPYEGLVFMVGCMVYLWAALAWKDQTVGMWMLRLKVYRDDSYARLGWRRALWRVLLQHWGLIALGMTFSLMLFGFNISHLVFDSNLMMEGGPHSMHLAFLATKALIVLGYAAGLMMIGLHPYKRALHDIWSRSRVLYRIQDAGPCEKSFASSMPPLETS